MSTLFQHQCAKHLWDMKGGLHRRYPGSRSPLETIPPEEIGSQHVPGSGGPRIDRKERDAHRAIPNAKIAVDMRRDFYPRSPHPSLLVIRAIEIHIDINPFPLWRYFEFFVSSNAC